MKSNQVKKYYRRVRWKPNYQSRVFNRHVTTDGLIVGSFDYNNGDVSIGFSKRVDNENAKDEFNRERANDIAYGRLQVGNLTGNINDMDSLVNLSHKIPAKLRETYWWAIDEMSRRFNKRFSNNISS